MQRFLRHPVTRNSSALLITQSLGYLAPLLTVPHLTRTLGLEAYGALAMSLSLLQVCVLVLDFGMTLSVTPLISTQRQEPRQVGELLGALLLIKTVLLVLTVAALILAMYSGLLDDDYQLIYWLTLSVAAAIAAQPAWLLQGIERAGPLAWAALAAQLCYLALVLLWVTTPADVAWALMAQLLAQFVAAGIGWRAVATAGLLPRRPQLAKVGHLARYSAPFFASRLAVASYTMTGTAVVGILTSTTLAAGYFLAEQIFKALQALVYPATQTLYAHLAGKRDLQLLRRVATTVCIAIWCCSALTAVSAPWIISVVAGEEFLGSVPALQILMLALAFSAPSLFLGYPLFSAMGRSAGANRGVIVASGIHLVILAALVAMERVSPTAIAAAVALAEGCVLVIRAHDAATLLRHSAAAPYGQ